MHGTGRFAMNTAMGLSNMGFWISSPARYAYHTLRGEGSVMEDYSYHRQNLTQLQSSGESFLQRAFPGNQNSLVFQSARTITETSLEVSTLASLGRTALQRGSSWMNMSGSSLVKTGEFARIKNFELNRFDQAAQNLSETGQNNIRILRAWAKSKGWEKMPNSQGGPETWGNINSLKNKFEWRLKIKPEASFREGLQTDSKVPRASARMEEGLYINPFTGETGGVKIGGHLPLEVQYNK
jgi:hypothetical protein